MYCIYRIVESIASSVSQYESYRDQVYRYTPNHIFLVMLLTWVIMEESCQNLFFWQILLFFLS